MFRVGRRCFLVSPPIPNFSNHSLKHGAKKKKKKKKKQRKIHWCVKDSHISHDLIKTPINTDLQRMTFLKFQLLDDLTKYQRFK